MSHVKHACIILSKHMQSLHESKKTSIAGGLEVVYIPSAQTAQRENW